MKRMKYKRLRWVLAHILVLTLTFGLLAGLNFVMAGSPVVPHRTVIEFGQFNGQGFPANRNAGNTGAGGHAMRWVVVDTDGDTVYLLAEQHLFHNVGANWWGGNPPMVAFEPVAGRPATDAPFNSWAHSHINTYLNTAFLANTFTEAQRGAILNYGTGVFYNRNNNFAPGGQQRVVIPSSAEMNSWFDNDPLLMASLHANATAATAEGGNPGWVWLRDPGAAPGLVRLVDGLRGADYRPDGFDVHYDMGAIRPLIRVNWDEMEDLIGSGGAVNHGIPQTPPQIRSISPTGDGLHPASINTITIEFGQRVDTSGSGTVQIIAGTESPVTLAGARTWDTHGRTVTIDASGFNFEFDTEYTLVVSGFTAVVNGVVMPQDSRPIFTTREEFAFGERAEFGEYNGNPLVWEIVEEDYHANTVTLLLTNRLYVGPFRDVSNADVNNVGNNVWANSTIRADLAALRNTLFTSEERAAMEQNAEGDYIFIPSASEYYRWFPDPAIRNSHPGNARNWWLRDAVSPHLRNVGMPRHYSSAMYVTMEIGRVAHTGALVNSIMGVRPVVIVCADFLDIEITDPGNGGPTGPPRVTPNPGQFVTATIAGIPIDMGSGIQATNHPTPTELTNLVGNPALHGRIILTQREALGAVPSFVPQPGDNVRAVRIPGNQVGIIPGLNLQTGHGAYHDGLGAFYFHDGNNVAIALDLVDGDIIMVYYRGWNNPPWAYFVVVEIVQWNYDDNGGNGPPTFTPNPGPFVTALIGAGAFENNDGVTIDVGTPVHIPAADNSNWPVSNAAFDRFRTDLQDQRGMVVLTAAQAANASANIRWGGGDNRVVHFSNPDNATAYRIQNGPFMLNTSGNVNNPVTLSNGDVIGIQMRPWGAGAWGPGWVANDRLYFWIDVVVLP